MTKIRPISSAPRHGASPAGALEWVGGFVTLAGFVAKPRPYRPIVSVWLELPTQVIVGHAVSGPDDPPLLSVALEEALARPLAGPPRRPARIRVADPTLAAEIREAAGGVRVVVAPTPEVTALFEEMDADLSDPHHSAASRNAPCPCGSGKKYKKCCLPREQENPARGKHRQADELRRLEAKVAGDLLDFAFQQFGDDWLDAQNDFLDPALAAPLAVPWSLYTFEVRGRPAVEWYVEKRGSLVTDAERAWLESQQRSWLSVWEVEEIRPGQGMRLKDLLSGVERNVTDADASESLVVWDSVLARVVDHDGLSVLMGVHPHALPPAEATEAVRRARARLRRKADVPIDRLRTASFGRALIRYWEQVVDEAEARSDEEPRMQNTDGHPLRLTADRYTFEPSRRADVEARLAAMDGVSSDESTAGERTFRALRKGNAAGIPMEATVIATLVVSERDLLVETNSIRRANALRKQVEAACGDLVRRGARKFDEPQRPPRAGGLRAARPPLSPMEEARLVREWKERFYADWVDHSLPALGGRTPREAVQTKAGRRDVELLLKSMEHREARRSTDSYDFGKIRAALGLEG